MILALDQSSRISGWAVLDGQSLIAYGHCIHEEDNLMRRIIKLCQEIEKLIEQYKPTKIILENIQLQAGNVDTFQKLAWVQGAIQYMLSTKYPSLPYELIYPTEWRSKCDFLKGKGKSRVEQKKIAQQWVKETFDKKCTQDEADAICIGWAINKTEINFK